MEVMQKVTIGGLILNKLQWADDVVLLAESAKDVSALARCARDYLGKVGLRINPQVLAHGLQKLCGCHH